MQITYLPEGFMILSYCIIRPIFQITIAVIGNNLRNKNFNSNNFWLRSHKWEKMDKFINNHLKYTNGNIYFLMEQKHIREDLEKTIEKL